ncbi:hypothetical protein BWD07_00915 [Neisseria canis]|nr:hypothetical protein BWD07_00915 [Neisseria canis]
MQSALYIYYRKPAFLILFHFPHKFICFYVKQTQFYSITVEIILQALILQMHNLQHHKNDFLKQYIKLLPIT